MLMYENEILSRDKFESINYKELEQSLLPVEDMEINCVFCGILFYSAEAVEMHIAEVHEENNHAEMNTNKIIIKKEAFYPPPVQIKPSFSMCISTPEKLTVFDSEMKIVDFEQIKLDQVKLCMRCNRHFLDDECLSHHQFKEHAIRKRKRTSHPNCVEGIMVTLDGTWGCDICTRVFATLKQAKVHKFKSHIEPAQKQEMLSSEFSRRYINGDEQTTMIQQYRQILPNELLPPKLPLLALNNSFRTNNITLVVSSPPTNESDTKFNAVAMDLSQSPSPTATNNQTPDSIWKVKPSDNQDTKISLSKVVQEAVISKEEDNQKNNAFFAYNSTTNQYVCSHCPAMFSSRAVYSRHILVHRRGKAFVCDGCGMAFTRNHTLKQHKDAKCVIANPIMGINCQIADQCPKCGLFFSSANSHLSHCRKICKVLFGNPLEESTRDSMKSEETSAQCEGDLEIDLEENDNSIPLLISDFINNPSFVTKGTNEFNCKLCCCYFPSFKSIGHHLEHYHRVETKRQKVDQVTEIVPNSPAAQETLKPHSPVKIEVKREESWWSRKEDTSVSPPPKMLTPNNFTLPPIIGMSSSNEILNLSTHSDSTGLRQSGFTQFHYKPRSARKMKIQPNANGEFECTECHKAFGCRSSLSNHIKSHFNLRNKPFSCGKCGQGFMSNVSYEEHVNSQCLNVHGTNAIGGNPMISPGTIMYGLSGSSPSSGRSTCCMHCSATFPDRSLLEDHAAREHSTDNGEVQCIKCSRSFSTYMAFRVHMTKSHGGPNGTPLKNSLSIATTMPFLVPYSSFSNLPVSTPVLRYKCTNCSQEFGNSQTFEHHKVTCPVTFPGNNESPFSSNQFVAQ